jgi:putative endonuclease
MDWQGALRADGLILELPRWQVPRNEKEGPNPDILFNRPATMLNWLRRFLEADGMPSTPAAQRGSEGERLAAEFLHGRAGYEIIARNWRNPRERREEIDLVCRDGAVLVFVEVKTRSADAMVPGFFAVDRRKKRALRRAIHAYLTQLRVRPRTFRFDVTEVILGGNTPPQVLHFQNVSLFPKGYHVLR